ncbi:hypothetical protein Cpir12675_001192 [Ceratocystis pirilliformis]|uniref:Histone deacetylase complex subunit SAP30 Sin3 binding domain-containing protein n=1 Tax=Ceratocystis pirilliformis TaxID=259994 RepID=A0ABR3ZJG5_9PEZI
MAPSKPRNHDDSKADGPREKGNSKKRQAKETPVLPPIQSRAASPEHPNASIDWLKFDREALHNYRREHTLDTPPTYLHSSYHFWLSLPGSIGTMSPTMVAARRRNHRLQRQTREKLAATVQRHFDETTINEADAMVHFISTLRQQGTRPQRLILTPTEPLINKGVAKQFL